MIPLPPEFERVDAALKSRTMTGQEAGRYIFAARRKLGPPWHWKSWKVARKKVLGTQCETCGAGSEAVLYVQHTFRLPRVRPYIDKARSDADDQELEADYRSALYEEYAEIQNSVEPEQRDCCPLCGSLAIQFRKKAATWICNGRLQGSGYCAHVFTIPAKKEALTPQQKKSIRIEKHRAWRRTILARKDDWMRDAMLAWIADMRRYLSLRDTKTLCKRCAFVEDMTDARTCRVCGFVYERSEAQCPDCGAQHATTA